MQNAWIFLFLAIGVEVFATTVLKATEGFTRLVPTVLSLGSYGLSFFFLSLSLKHIPIAIAYAIWSGVGIIAIPLIASWVHGQRLDIPALIGIGVIVLGVLIIQLSR